MRPHHEITPRLLLAAALLGTAACATSGGDWTELPVPTPGTGPTFTLAGTVEHLEVEGGVTVIRDSSGDAWQPLNLPATLADPGTRLETIARRRDDLASIGMVGPLVELTRVRKLAGPPVSLSGTEWRLTQMPGVVLVPNAPITMMFGFDRAVAGRTGCNSYSGTAITTDDQIIFSAMAMTRMACAPALMRQEDAFVARLRGATRFEVDGDRLRIFVAGSPEPMRFTRATRP
jgi:heat shock protein HslJ